PLDLCEGVVPCTRRAPSKFYREQPAPHDRTITAEGKPCPPKGANARPNTHSLLLGSYREKRFALPSLNFLKLPFFRPAFRSHPPQGRVHHAISRTVPFC